jgi:leucyl-tRNA---protein transferase
LLKPYFYSLNPDSLKQSELDLLLSLGWYRMHQHVFACSHLNLEVPHRVHWLRYPLAEIKIHSSHKRIRKNCRAFRYTIEVSSTIPDAHESLYANYRQTIDFDGADTVHQCLFGEAEASENIFKTRCISVFDRERLIAGGYFDVGENSAASILHFFDPCYKNYSLGKYLMLLTVDFLQSSGYTFYYPGYLVVGNPKMNYKLFIGKEATQYFESETATWFYFQEHILVGE